MVVGLVAICMAGMFASCGSDDDNKASNTLTVNGKEYKVQAVLVQNALGRYTVSIAGMSGITNLASVTLDIPEKLEGKVIALSPPGDWVFQLGSLIGGPGVVFDKGSSLFIKKKSSDTYQITFNVKKTEAGKTTTASFNFDGKPFTHNSL